jgi:hypothetical protein
MIRGSALQRLAGQRLHGRSSAHHARDHPLQQPGRDPGSEGQREERDESDEPVVCMPWLGGMGVAQTAPSTLPSYVPWAVHHSSARSA